MEIDITLKEIFLETQKEMLEERGIHLSIKEIAELFESQFHCAKVGFIKGINIRLPKWGTFIDKKPRVKGNIANQLKDRRAELGEEEYQKQVLALKMRFKKETSAARTAGAISLDELKNIPNRVNTPTIYDDVL